MIGLALISLICCSLAQSTDSPGTTVDNALRLDQTASHWPDIEVKRGNNAFVELIRKGGTGYSWEAAVADSRVVAVARVTTRIESNSADGMKVGRPEVDLFMISGLSIGETRVTFELRRIRSTPINTVSTKIKVTE